MADQLGLGTNGAATVCERVADRLALMSDDTMTLLAFHAQDHDLYLLPEHRQHLDDLIEADDFEGYVNWIRKEGVWIGEAELRALAIEFGRPVHVVSSNFELVYPATSQAPSAAIFVGRAGRHYYSLRPRTGAAKPASSAESKKAAAAARVGVSKQGRQGRLSASPAGDQDEVEDASESLFSSHSSKSEGSDNDNDSLKAKTKAPKRGKAVRRKVRVAEHAVPAQFLERPSLTETALEYGASVSKNHQRMS